MRDPSPAESAVFEACCGIVTGAERAALRAAVQRHLHDLRQAARRDELLPVDLAEALAGHLDTLLVGLDALPPDAHPLVVGAARYFVSDNDAIPDRQGVLGLDDDVAVFNAVARRIGRDDLQILEPSE